MNFFIVNDGIPSGDNDMKSFGPQINLAKFFGDFR